MSKDYSILDSIQNPLEKAYDLGYQQGVIDNDKTYRRGADDMLDAMRYIFLAPGLGGMTEEEQDRVFDNRSGIEIVSSLKSSEIIAKIYAYKYLKEKELGRSKDDRS